MIAVIITVALGFTLAYMNMIVVALPAIQQQFAISSAAVLWIVNIYMLVRAMLVLGSGRLSDILSHRRLFLIGVVLFLLGSVGGALSPDIDYLVLFRGLQGIGVTFVFVSGVSLITARVPSERRGKAMGLALSIGLISLAIAPSIGGAITQYLSWRWIFWINFIVSAIVIVMVLLFIKPMPVKQDSRRFD